MILITGFKPFQSQSINSSWEVAKLIAEEESDYKILELPVEYEEAFKKLNILLQNLKTFPDKLILLGQAGERNKISIERVALNWNESQFPDEAGVYKNGEPIIENAPSCFIQKFNLNLSKEELKYIQVSHSAGAYVCNDLYFRCLYQWADFMDKIIFIHTPLVELDGIGLELKIQAREIKKIISYI